MKNKYLIFYVSILFFLLNLSSCGMMMMGGKKEKFSVYEEYYINEGITQYFVKPLIFKSKDYKFTIDYTFRDSITTSFVTANSSLFSDQPIKTIDSIIILIDNSKKVKVKNNKKLFIDMKKKYQIRHSGNISYNELKTFFSGTVFEVNVFTNNSNIILFPSKQTLKSIRLFNTHGIEIIELNK